MARSRIRTIFVLSGTFAAGFAAHALVGTAEAKPAAESPYAAMAQLGRVLTLVENEFVDPVDRTKLVNGALAGMVDGLDPHSSYLPPNDYRELQNDTEGKFAGIGVEVEFRDETILVLATIENSPAEHAGLRAGDLILTVDGQSIKDIGYESLVRRMRGLPGTHVKLSVLHPRHHEAAQVDVVRAEIHQTSVRGGMLPDKVAYVQVRQFQDKTAEEFQRVAGRLHAEANGPISGVVLDLRGNPGGLVDQAAAVADEFLDSGTIYTMRHRGQIVETATAHGGGAFVGVPIVILMSTLSASASELVAGALQDSVHATVVGTRSYGKGVVQSIQDLPNGAGLKLTTARYYTPNGHGVQGEGIYPDVRVEVAGDAGLSFHESDRPNALPSEGSMAHDAGAVFTYDLPDGGTEPLVSRDVPTDPRAGNDAVMRIGYETLLKKIAAGKK